MTIFVSAFALSVACERLFGVNSMGVNCEASSDLSLHLALSGITYSLWRKEKKADFTLVNKGKEEMIYNTYVYFDDIVVTRSWEEEIAMLQMPFWVSFLLSKIRACWVFS